MDSDILNQRELPTLQLLYASDDHTTT